MFARSGAISQSAGAEGLERWLEARADWQDPRSHLRNLCDCLLLDLRTHCITCGARRWRRRRRRRISAAALWRKLKNRRDLNKENIQIIRCSNPIYRRAILGKLSRRLVLIRCLVSPLDPLATCVVAIESASRRLK